MARVAVSMPHAGSGMETGAVSAWHKQVGDRIERGEVIAEIETDKTTLELEARVSGVLVEIVAAVGDEVPVGEPIAYVEDGQT